MLPLPSMLSMKKGAEVADWLNVWCKFKPGIAVKFEFVQKRAVPGIKIACKAQHLRHQLLYYSS